MKDTKILMGMPITVEVVDSDVRLGDIEAVYEYFKYVDEKFSTYKKNSEVMKINRPNTVKI
jgi:thiamine biosynthesis lipoprotein